jgi:hypothetical protein
VVQLDLELDEESSHSTAGTVRIGHLDVTLESRHAFELLVF